MLGFAVESILANGVGAMVLFASEVSSMKAKNTISFSEYLSPGVCHSHGKRFECNGEICVVYLGVSSCCISWW